jgi:hypothetical protein
MSRQIQNVRDVNDMDQKSIILYLARKKLSPQAIINDLEATFGKETMNYQSVMHYF